MRGISLSTRDMHLLRLLADGEFHSGQVLAAALGISRGTIWNALARIEAAGIEVFRVHKRGYRLARPFELLDPLLVARALGPRQSEFRIEIVPVIASTNGALLAHAAAGAGGGQVLAAEVQTAGRGRRGRPWLSPPGGALAFSLLWRFQQGAAWLGGLSLAVGVALLRALRDDAGDLQLKWPNDVVVNGRKLAGILIEMQGDTSGPSAVVIGIGLNLALPAIAREGIDQAVVDLAELGVAAPSRNGLLAKILGSLHDVLTQFAAEGFVPFREEWLACHAHQDRPVAVQQPDGALTTGIARGVAADGALLLAAATGMQRIVSGDVSLRAAG